MGKRVRPLSIGQTSHTFDRNVSGEEAFILEGTCVCVCLCVCNKRYFSFSFKVSFSSTTKNVTDLLQFDL